MLKSTMRYGWSRLALAVLGSLIYALGINLFVTPLGLYTGGLMGICQLLRTLILSALHVSSLPFDLAGVVFYAINVPLLAIAWRFMGPIFFRNTVICATTYTLFVSLVPVPAQPLVDDVLTSCLLGGVISGVGVLDWSALKTASIKQYFKIVDDLGAVYSGDAVQIMTGTIPSAVVEQLNPIKSLYIPEFIIRGMYINGDYYRPTFFFESCWNLLGFIILLVIRKFYKNLKTGQLLGFYMMWYSFIRFIIEGMRLDSLMFGPIRVAQLVSVVLFIVGVYFVFFRRKKVLYREDVLYE